MDGSTVAASWILAESRLQWVQHLGLIGHS
jgi:hypothetical protein